MKRSRVELLPNMNSVECCGWRKLETMSLALNRGENPYFILNHLSSAQP